MAQLRLVYFLPWLGPIISMLLVLGLGEGTQARKNDPTPIIDFIYVLTKKEREAHAHFEPVQSYPWDGSGYEF